MSPRAGPAASSVLLLLLCTTIAQHSAAIQTQWPNWGGNKENWRYSDHSCIDKTKLGNLSKTKPTWTITAGSTVTPTPTTCGGFIYFVALSSVTKVSSKGAVQWTKTIASMGGGESRASLVFSQDCSTAYLGTTMWLGNSQAQAYLLSINTANGALINKVLLDDFNPKTSRITCSPTSYGGSVYIGISSSEEGTQNCCAFRGSFVRVDGRNLSIVWRRIMVPVGYSGGSVWGSSPAIDELRSRVCVGTGNNYQVPQSVVQCISNAGIDLVKQAQCVSAENYINSIVCMDIATGRVAMVYSPIQKEQRTSTLDLWTGGFTKPPTLNRPSILGSVDADFAQAPMLIPNMADRSKDLLIGTPKSGRMVAIYAATGNAAWGPFDLNLGLPEGKGSAMFGSCTNGKVVCSALFYWQVSKSGFTGSVECRDVTSGARKWRIMVKEKMAVYGPLTCTQELVFAPLLNQAGSLMVLDIINGKELGRYNTGATLFCGPAIVNGTLYVGSGYKSKGLAAQMAYAVPLPLKPGVAC